MGDSKRHGNEERKEQLHSYIDNKYRKELKPMHSLNEL